MISRSGSWPLQRASTVIIEKSLREGFGLTVTEGLWKKKPVVASAGGWHPHADCPQAYGFARAFGRRRRLSDSISALESFIGATTG